MRTPMCFSQRSSAASSWWRHHELWLLTGRGDRLPHSDLEQHVGSVIVQWFGSVFSLLDAKSGGFSRAEIPKIDETLVAGRSKEELHAVAQTYVEEESRAKDGGYCFGVGLISKQTMWPRNTTPRWLFPTITGGRLRSGLAHIGSMNPRISVVVAAGVQR
ncbi:hypothetical protein Bca101_013003 [Brassica carinata]